MIITDCIYNTDCLGSQGLVIVPDSSVDLVLADLPYGVTANKWDKLLDLDALFAHYRRILKTPGTIVLTGQQPFTTDLINAGRDLFKYEIIWNKKQGANMLKTNVMPLYIHENILIFSNAPCNWQSSPRMKFNNFGRREYKKRASKLNNKNNPKYGKHGKEIYASGTAQKSIVTYAKELTGDHGTQKPVALFEYLIKTYSDPGDTVLDNCMGSGTTAIACIKTARTYIGFETVPEFYQICQDRVSKELTARSFFTEPDKPEWIQQNL